jgi:hypothetical protein
MSCKTLIYVGKIKFWFGMLSQSDAISDGVGAIGEIFDMLGGLGFS